MTSRASSDLHRRLRLLLVTDRRRAQGSLELTVREAIRGGVTAVMLRERDLDTAELIALGRPLRDDCRSAGVLFLVNGDVAAARALGADGVHLGYGAPPPSAARNELGEGALLGASTHDEEELARSLRDGVDYVTFGPVYATPKADHERSPRGLDLLRDAVAQAAPVPVVALGGVQPSRVAELRGTGVAGIAGIRCFLHGIGEPATTDTTPTLRATRQLRRAWDGWDLSGTTSEVSA